MTATWPYLQIGLKVAFGCALLAIILAMAIIDSRKMVLPNWLNLLLAGTGIAQVMVVGQPGVLDAALGALVGIGVLSVVAMLFRHFRGIEGLGLGDQKFAAAAGLWIGWQDVAPMLLMASLSALAFVIFRSIQDRSFDIGARLPFGPFLGLGTFIVWATTATGS